ncbi:MAG TPA: CoA-acylating methylmalonate-semialdehyde dehydrogenase [Pseudomonadales bacterium]|jgi:malonate-semialdehyde dehydrogenase (acetylating)/methylmalonate-semialdehyde dehydrogenase
MPATIPHFIDGALFASAAPSLPVFNPATAAVIRHVGIADTGTVQKAVTSAQAAFPAWSATPPVQRARILFKARELMDQQRDALAALICEEHGKTLADADGEISRGLEVIEFACGIPHLLKGEHSPHVGRGVDSWSQYAPLGVVAGITPFNFPAMVPLWMIPIALACGNTFILKPSERTPSAANRIAAIFSEAGLPDGVLNVVHGNADTANALMDDPRVQAVSFVGSTPVAQAIYARASALGKRAQALGGAKNHMVVMPDADIPGTCDALLGAAFGSAGERCMAAAITVAIGNDTADALRDELAARIKTLRIDNGRTNPDMGPVITDTHRQKITALIDSGMSEGASLIVDGRTILADKPGFFMGGSLFDHVTPAMRIYKEEIFGPVLGIVRCNSLDEAIALINAHEYGNGAVIFTRNGDAARTFSQQIAAGMVGINVPVPVPMAFHSFGGWKRSLFGPLHMHGPDGVRFYTRLKTVTARWPDSLSDSAEFVMPVAR